MECRLCATVNEKYRHIMENENAIAIIILEPQIDYHSLVLPKRHVTKLVDLRPDESYDLHVLVEDLTQRMDKVLGCAAIATLNGVKYRTQSHIHYQIFPIYEGLRTVISSHLNIAERKKVSQDELERMAKKLRL
jgi:diadenosine tetraphosphate (Ap4A) HIT family hydrolase